MFARIALRSARMAQMKSPYACTLVGRQSTHVRAFSIGHRPPLRQAQVAKSPERTSLMKATPVLVKQLAQQLTYATRARSRKLLRETTLALG